MSQLITEYEQAIKTGYIKDDQQQREVIFHLQRIVDEMTHTHHSWFNFRRKKNIQGLYLYGPVGAGKTYLMDLFYKHVPDRNKLRVHFHRFMQQIDAKLRQLQGHKNPLKRIATDIAKSAQVLCLDEFLVYDVADAMILTELFQVLLANHVVLIITSNTAPNQLYLNGAQRANFLPTIALIMSHCEVLILNAAEDYRLSHHSNFPAYFYPINETSVQQFMVQFNTLVINPLKNGELNIQNRLIKFLQCGGRVVWFTFKILFNTPRCQLDYLEIAERFDTIFISEVPALTRDDTTSVLLFIQFIDVIYDKKIRLVLLADVSLENLYIEGPMIKSYQRTLSRLKEMQ